MSFLFFFFSRRFSKREEKNILKTKLLPVKKRLRRLEIDAMSMLVPQT